MEAGDLKVTCNVPTARVFKNIRAALGRGLPIIKSPSPATTTPAVLCGSGPSLLGFIHDVDARQRNGASIFALNGAARTLNEFNIVPDHMVLLDARAKNVDLVDKTIAAQYLIATQCSSKVLDALEGKPVLLYNADVPGVDAVTPPDSWFIGAALTVGLSSLMLAFTLGHREFHIFGYDSSLYEGKLHAHDQQVTAREAETIEARAGGRTFVSTFAMAKQAKLFPHIVNLLMQHGAEQIAVYGDGLLPEVAREAGRLALLNQEVANELPV